MTSAKCQGNDGAQHRGVLLTASREFGPQVGDKVIAVGTTLQKFIVDMELALTRPLL